MVSFSMVISSWAVYSGISGKGVSFTVLAEAVPAAMEKKSIWPSRFCRCWAAMESITDSKTLMSWERRAPVESKAPARMRFSTARLFMSLPDIRLQKSRRDVNGPLSRSRMTAWMKPRPMFLMATRPKRMPPSSTVKRSSERLMSGGSRAMPQSLHSLI